MPLVREVTIDGAQYFWRDSNGERWHIQNVNMEEGGVLVPKPADVAFHRAFSNDSGKQRIYAFRSFDHRGFNEEHVERQFRASIAVGDAGDG